MANKKNILPPPMNPQKKPVTVAVLTGKLDYLFKNVQELVTTTARGTEKVLREEMQEMEKRLDSKIDGVEKRLDSKIDGVEKRLDSKIDGVEKRLVNVENDVKEIKTAVNRLEEKFDDHGTRITTLETARL